MDREIIRVVGAREHNLKGIDLVVPRETLTVFTGVSGSGKSSLAFDTIFQEGQRRFLQSLSSYARQFLGSMEKPAVDSIEGLSPAISIDQKRRGRNPRSTVGTVTEIHDHLRLLFARLGTPHCPDCGHPIQARSPAEIATRLLAAGPGQRVLVLAPVIQDRKGEYRKEFKGWLADGYLRARVDGELVRLEQPPELDRYVRHTIELVLDRLVLAADGRNRLVEAVERAVGLTGGLVAFLRDTGEEEVHELHATAKACPGCGFSLPELEPRLFSFNSPHGACPSCEGIGLRHRPAPARIIPDPSRPLVGGAIACLTAEGKMPFVSFDLADIAAVARGAGQDPATPWRRLPASLRRLILEGSDGRLVPHRYAVPGDEAAGEVLLPCRGVLPALTLAWGWTRASFLERWFDIGPCPDCDGTRLKREARAVKLGGRDLGQVGDLTVEELARWVEALPLAPGLEQAVGGPLVREVLARAGFLQELGLGYLTLGRGAATLAGGEFQRIRLARQLGSHLQGVLYVLDEPSIGLHPQDNQRLIRTLEKLRDDGNTVLVVEHDEETLRAADHLVELGPDAGERGGWLVAQGTPRQVAAADTHSGRLLAGREIIPLPAARRPPDKGWLTLRNARQHNLQGIDVAIPLGVLTVVTGVSGSGKSTLVDLTLRRALAQRFHGAEDPPGLHDGIDGLEQLDKVIEIDQDPIGRTPRSNPATYVKLFDGIRDLFADLPEARARGYQKGRFSFNVKGGRCEECQGAGVKEIELQLLAPVAVPCEVCEGRRFNAETLQIRYRGKTITDVLEMTVEEARGFFGHHPGLARTLDTLLAVGLGYLRLGQPSTTLSGGEAQRVKLAAELRRPATGRTLYLLDEPTTGLHAHDVQLLLTALQQLVDAGNTVLVVEHDLDVIKVADHLIDLGPGGGAAGGRIVAQGTPEEVAADPTSLTGQALAAALRQARATPPPAAAARVAEAAVPYAAKAARVAAAVVPDAAKAASPAAGLRMRDLRVVEARQHNLQGIDVTLPGGKLSVITGVSGSGKSSLAFHTLFAEGQRRYVESLSTYARRFLGRQQDAHVRRIDGLAPAIAIDQQSAGRSPRSTVATVTEIHDHLRLLYARAGQPRCPECDCPLEAVSPSLAASRALQLLGAGPLLLLCPGPGTPLGKTAPELLAAGVHRVRLPSGELARLDGPLAPPLRRARTYHLVLDRPTLSPAGLSRLAEGIAAGYRHAGEVLLLPADEPGEPLVFTERACCPAHRVCLDAPLSPRRFSFNHHQGACPECAGLGLVPRDGRRPPALRPDPDQPPRRPEEPDPWGSWASTAGAGAVICPACQGERLAPLPRRVTLGGARLPELTRLSVTAARQALAELELGPEQRLIARDLLGEVDSRLRFLEEVGLGYLTLDRTAASLSGGEAQRIRLASQLGAYLTGCLYVLDEPTVGLHPRDTDRLLHTLESLRDQGNTVVVVEHDLDTIRRADWLLDLGPGPGELGGRVVAAGTPDEVARTPGSLTGDYLAGRRGLPLPTERRTGTAGLEVRGARANNLRGVDAGFAWGLITCVTGVSGSGKSSLVLEVLQQAAARALGQETTASHDYDALLGTKDLTRLVVVDQSPLGRTPRSNPASYTGLLDLLRTLFAGLPESKTRGYGAGRFSYNRAEGRCPTCEGMGALQVEMHFLSDVWVPCDACQGARYNEATLQVRYRGLSFADVLRLTVDEAAETFAQHRRIARILGMLQDVGLGYLRLGQAATTLSGGEAQRLKLATELGRRGGPGTLYLLDEPTTGLHPADVERLLAILQRLAARQAAVVVIEHNPEVIRLADRVLDLGPEGGAQGGELVVAGTPEEVAACARSHTGRYLGPLLAGGRDPRPASVCDGRRAAATRRPRPTRPAGVDSPDRLG